MKYIRTYKLFEGVGYASNEIGETIREILYDVSDNNFHVKYTYEPKRYDIIISTYEVGSGSTRDKTPDRMKWSDVSGAINRINSYLKEYNYYIDWSIYVSGQLTNKRNSDVLGFLDKVNPSAMDFEVNIRLYTHEEWKKLMDSH